MAIAWQSMGRSIKAPVEPSDFIPLIRRSLTAFRPIAAGQVISGGDLAIKRPGTGIEPRHFDAVVGMRAAVAIAEDETLTWDKFGVNPFRFTEPNYRATHGTARSKSSHR